MTEDLYTGKTTIRQVRQSLHPHFPMERVWNMIKAIGGPGIKEEKNYLICPSQAICNAIANMGAEQTQMVMNLWHEYCRKYPMTMLIQD